MTNRINRIFLSRNSLLGFWVHAKDTGAYKKKFPSSFDVKNFSSYCKKFFADIRRFIPDQAGAYRNLQGSSISKRRFQIINTLARSYQIWRIPHILLKKCDGLKTCWCSQWPTILRWRQKLFHIILNSNCEC